MTTDDERRDVAGRLRELSKYVFHPDNTYELLIDAFGADDGTDELFSRLADIIEPVERMCLYYDADTNHCGCYDTRLIDRDALLALADEMEVTGREYRHMVDENFVTSDLIDDAPEDFVEYASRIREACGEAGR